MNVGYKNKLWRMYWAYNIFPPIKIRGNYYIRGYNSRWKKNFVKKLIKDQL